MKISLKQLEERAKDRPPGYLQACLAAGDFDGNTLELSDAAYRKLVDEYRSQSMPSLKDVLENFAYATARWVAAGFPVTTEDQFKDRHAVCEPCQYWLNGRCRICGCWQLKLWWATEYCPQGFWHAIRTVEEPRKD